MSKLIIDGGNKLYGNVKIQSGKNALLPLISACIMVDGEVTFINCPRLKDTDIMLKIIESLGGKYKYEGNNLKIDCRSVHKYELPCELTSQIRASLFLLGPLIARFRKAFISMTGGCNIGSRPIDIHLDGFKKLGVEILDEGCYYFRADNLKANDITLKFASVGATINLIMASVLAKGTTILRNTAKEPEVIGLINFLNLFGCKIKGASSGTIIIEGVNRLEKKDVIFKPIPDRIECGTFIIAVLNVGGEITIENANFTHNFALIKKVLNNTCKISIFNDKIYIKSSGGGNGLGYIPVLPYPAFPTDLQTPILAYASTLKGTTIITEGVFPNRYGEVKELVKMGANIVVKNNVATIKGVSHLEGKEVEAYDLRGGAGLVIAGLKAQGETIINNAEIIMRGYDRIEDKLSNLGAKIKRL